MTWAEETKKKLAHIKVLPLAALKELPQAGPYDGGIYFLWLKGALVYIGKSRQIQERIAQLKQDAKYAWLVDAPRPRPFDHYTCLVVDEPMEKLPPILKDLERAYIAHHEPRYNHLDVNSRDLEMFCDPRHQQPTGTTSQEADPVRSRET